MAKLKDFDLTTLMNNLRVFEYEREGQTIRAELFPSSRGKNVAMILESLYGSLKADDVFYKPYEAGLLSENMIAATISDKNRDNWIHLLGITKSEYNPIWNVDGTVSTKTETEYGKITTLENGKIVTTEQLEVGKVETTYGKSSTTEQLVDGYVTTEYGKTITSEQLENSTVETEFGRKDTTQQLTDGTASTQHGLTTTTDQAANGKELNKTAAFNTSSMTTTSERDVDAGKTQVTNSGTDVVTTNSGKTEVGASGKDTVTSDAGKSKVEEGGDDAVTTSSGKVEVADSGKDSVESDAGKVAVSNTGNDVTKDTGKDVVTITETRGGNIGVTMTQQLLSAEADFWSQWNFFEAWFKTIVEVITIPIFEED